jgi:hypothetical protein
MVHTLAHSLKSYGTLIIPSQSVVKVVQVTDQILMQKKTLQEIKQQVLQETKLCDDHITTLFHGISDLYVKIFIHSFGKIYSENIVRGGKPSKRQKLNKLILFGND